MFDWRLALFIVQILTLIVSIAGTCLIKFNDLKHLSKDVSDIKNDVKNLHERQEHIGNEIVKIETRCQERHRD